MPPRYRRRLLYSPAPLPRPPKSPKGAALRMTVTAPSEFSGGGTGFWAGGRAVEESTDTAPDVVLTPAPGTVLLFGGDVTHAGMPVMDGLRSVFVASFSRG